MGALTMLASFGLVLLGVFIGLMVGALCNAARD